MTIHQGFQVHGGSVYGHAARFDTGHALTEDEIFKLAPSVFATEAHESRSDKFHPIATIDVVRGLAKEGFQVAGVKQGGTRIEGKAAFTKHLIRLRRFGEEGKYSVGDNVFELLLRNANDGTASYELLAGLFRIRCMNSLVTLSKELESVKVRHNGKNVINDVIEGTYRVLGESELALAAPQDWGKLQLTNDEQRLLAGAAHQIRFEVPEGERPAIEPEQLLRPRRQDDRATDLWTTWNVLQENAIKGGLHGSTYDANNNRRRITTREVKGIDQDVKLNRALWTIGKYFAEQKQAQ